MRGSWRGKTRPDEPVMKPSRLKAPAWLPASGKRLFSELADVLGDIGVTTRADRLALALLCQSYADFRAADDIVKEEGTITTTGLGAKKVHPACQLRNVARDQLVKSLAAFGLTPADRSRVSATGTEQPDIQVLLAEVVAAEKRRHA